MVRTASVITPGVPHHGVRRIETFFDDKNYLWWSRFASFPMDEDDLLGSTRYIDLNPV